MVKSEWKQPTTNKCHRHRSVEPNVCESLLLSSGSINTIFFYFFLWNLETAPTPGKFWGHPKAVGLKVSIVAPPSIAAPPNGDDGPLKGDPSVAKPP